MDCSSVTATTVHSHRAALIKRNFLQVRSRIKAKKAVESLREGVDDS